MYPQAVANKKWLNTGCVQRSHFIQCGSTVEVMSLNKEMQYSRHSFWPDRISLLSYNFSGILQTAIHWVLTPKSHFNVLSGRLIWQKEGKNCWHTGMFGIGNCRKCGVNASEHNEWFCSETWHLTGFLTHCSSTTSVIMALNKQRVKIRERIHNWSEIKIGTEKMCKK